MLHTSPIINLNLIEPTLHDQAGHGYSYAYSLIYANAKINAAHTGNSTQFNIKLWLDRRGKGLFTSVTDSFSACKPHLYFQRKMRQLQKIFLYRQLLSKPEIIYICTAGMVDLIILNLLTNGLIFNAISNRSNNAKTKLKAKVILHFHQFKQNSRKLALLKKIAAKNPNFVIFTPTEKLTQIFRSHGFINCQTIPCPTFPRDMLSLQKTINVANSDNAGKIQTNNVNRKHSDKNTSKAHQTYVDKEYSSNINIANTIATVPFQKLLYAGAARNDKGFPEVVNFISHLRKSGNYLPAEIQISTPHSAHYDANTAMALEKLSALPAEGLTVHRHTLARAEYQNLFTAAICLLLYDHSSYQDKFSGVALDAFYAGCPIITAKHTWMGNTAEKFSAGIALERYTPDAIMQAVYLIRDAYHTFSQNALIAATVLAKEHDPANTLRAIATA